MNDISLKWEKWFHTCVTRIAYIIYNDQWIFLIFGTQVKKTTAFCSTNGDCQIPVAFWGTWRQNFDNFFLGHTVVHGRRQGHGIMNENIGHEISSRSKQNGPSGRELERSCAENEARIVTCTQPRWINAKK